MENCRFESMRYRNEFFDSHYSGGLAVSKYGDDWSRFRILAPDLTDLMKYLNFYKKCVSIPNLLLQNIKTTLKRF